MRRHFKVALDNVIRYGDTDVFPFPVEKTIYGDRYNDVLALLEDIHCEDTIDDKNDEKFFEFLDAYPLEHEDSLVAVGYNAYRTATQMDPIWNVYLLGLVTSIAGDIERDRVAKEQNVVFSYRYQPSSDALLWDKDYSWVQFQRHSVELSREYSHVLRTDISDFYTRIYHHSLENALNRATPNTNNARRIMRLLSSLSAGVSYGLPVGGPAARLLSELLLNATDKLLRTKGIRFCRFADDYHIFCNSNEECYRNLVLLSTALQQNEGLSLQKAKTRVMTGEEFRATSESFQDSLRPTPDEIGRMNAAALRELIEEFDIGIDKGIRKVADLRQAVRSELWGEETSDDAETRSFLSLRLPFDYKSVTADEDFEELKAKVHQFDVVGMLGREMQKTRIHQAMMRRLVQAVKFLEPEVRNRAMTSLIDNIETLYPVYPNVMMLIRDGLDEADAETRSHIFEGVRTLVLKDSHIVQIPVNMAFTVRVLAEDDSTEGDITLSKIYDSTKSMMVKRDVILAMAARRATYWLDDNRRNYRTLTTWERTALLLGSFVLGDAGNFWRNKIKRGLSPMDKLVKDWGEAKHKKKDWRIPI